MLYTKTYASLPAGEHAHYTDLKEPLGTYLVTVETAYEKATQKVIIEP